MNDHKSNVSRFMSKIKVNEKDCWIWTAQIAPNGYGRFWLDKNMSAHRASWLLFNGEIPSNLHVCHKCDTPPCVNPEHLFLGTHKDNMNDRKIKGRQAKQKKTFEKHEETELLKLYNSGISQRDLAEMFDVSQRTIGRYLHLYYTPSNSKGSNNNKSKLTEEQVLSIRKMHISHKFSCMKISKIFCVSESAIKRIISRKTWKHI